MRWGSLSGFVQNVLGQASPGLTTVGGWLWPSEGLGVRLATVSPSLPLEAVGGTGSWPHTALFLSWGLIQPGNFL